MRRIKSNQMHSCIDRMMGFNTKTPLNICRYWCIECININHSLHGRAPGGVCYGCNSCKSTTHLLNENSIHISTYFSDISMYCIVYIFCIGIENVHTIYIYTSKCKCILIKIHTRWFIAIARANAVHAVASSFHFELQHIV